ncbi:MAG TPA: hypothetical protein VFI12_05555 [Thermomicrobiales bacterium]|nr:hypothetical protein [Thermomicrobiales bacterium]
MDFVVVGIVIGAIIVGAGAVVRDLGPRRRPFIDRRIRREISPEAKAKAWRRFCQSLGTFVLTMGMIVILATVVAMVLSLSDSTGWLMVGASSALALVASGIGVLVIPGHYQRGGFDPVIKQVTVRPAKAPPPVVMHDVEVPLSELPGDSIDDLFSLDVGLEMPEPVPAPVEHMPAPAESVPIDDGITLPGTVFAEPEEPVDILPLTREPELTSPAAAEPHAERRSARRVTFSRPNTTRSDPEQTPSPARPVREPDPMPPVYETPLIDPDEDLPAWNAQPKPIPQPQPYVPPARVERPQSDPETGFQSSLFSDLSASGEEGTDVTGPFQSRLLNELTRNERRPEPEPEGGGADVLIDEVSLPVRNPNEQRNANNGR